jgi:hypothetical protein
MAEKDNPKWRAYITWLNTPEHLRGTVVSEEDWAAANGTSTRTTRRWKQDPAFVDLRDELTDEAVSALDVSPVEAGEEATYRAVKAKLVEGARGGNVKSLELYFRTYGKPFVEEEAAARSVDLSNMELPALVARAVAALAPDDLEQVLVSAGWTVQRPAGD